MLRTSCAPLAGLKMQLELAPEHPMPPAAADLVGHAREATDRIARMANQLPLRSRAPSPVLRPARRRCSTSQPKSASWSTRTSTPLAADVDLGYEREPAPVRGNATRCASWRPT